MPAFTDRENSVNAARPRCSLESPVDVLKGSMPDCKQCLPACTAGEASVGAAKLDCSLESPVDVLNASIPDRKQCVPAYIVGENGIDAAEQDCTSELPVEVLEWSMPAPRHPAPRQCLPTFVVSKNDIDAAEQDSSLKSPVEVLEGSSVAQLRHKARMQQLEEVNRLFGDRLQQWLDVCLSGQTITDFPLPLVKRHASEVNDPAGTDSLPQTKITSNDKLAKKHGPPIAQTPFVVRGRRRLKNIAKQGMSMKIMPL